MEYSLQKHILDVMGRDGDGTTLLLSRPSLLQVTPHTIAYN
jgi:hypothetical protein